MDEALQAILDRTRCPALCVEDGSLCHITPAARQYMLPLGTAIESLLATGREEYAAYIDGSLYLTLNLSPLSPEPTLRDAEMVQLKGYRIFYLEEPEVTPELQALALAAVELRKPLSSILPEMEALEKACPEQAAKINRRLFQLMRLASNMADAAAYAQPNAGRMEVIQATALYDELFQKAGALLEKAGIRLEYTGLTQPVFTLADPELLERAAYNLLSNAAKHLPPGGCIQVQLSHSGNRLSLSVSDNGPGIPDPESLYPGFLRSPGWGDPRRGLGLGLVLVRSAASLHGGTVLVDQKAQQGCRTTMTLAIRQPKKPAVHTPAARLDLSGGWDRPMVELSDCLPAELYNRI